MLVELHLIQNFAPSCLNRDDTNAPKDCVFGGVRRARISSQCWKRAMRRYLADNADALLVQGKLGTRTKLLQQELIERAVRMKRTPVEAAAVTKKAIEGAGLKFDDGQNRTSVLLFLGPAQIDALASAIDKNWDAIASWEPGSDGDEEATEEAKAKGKAKGKGKKDKKKVPPPKELAEAFKALAQGPQAIDVALFGRMIAELKDMNVDAASQVAHAISTNRVDMEMDFYTAVDDLQPRDETGAGMMGIVEFNSSCFYRYLTLDVEQLRENLGNDMDLTRRAVRAFVEAAVHAIPTARQNSMAAHNLPDYVRAIVRSKSAPRSFANAFLQPVRSDRERDLTESTIKMLLGYETDLNRMYGKEGIKVDLTSSRVDPSSKSVKSLIDQVEECIK